METKKPKKRAVADNTEVGMQRYELYKYAIDCTTKAIEEGFYLEAITITESMIADRLESRLNYLCQDQNEEFSFKTLEKLIKGIKKYDTDEEMKQLVLHDLDKWREGRNKSLHELVKFSEASMRSADIIQAENEKIAKEGVELRKKIFARVAKLKK